MYLDASESRTTSGGRIGPPHTTIAREAVGWMVVIALGVGAVGMGLRPLVTLWPAVGLVALAFVMWVPDMIRRRAMSKAMAIVLSLAGLLVVYGVIGALNARATYDLQHRQLVPLPNIAWLPSVVEVTNTLPDLSGVMAALALLVMGMDLGRSARWRSRLVAALAFGGVMTAAIGLLEQTSLLSGVQAFLTRSRWSDAQPFGMLAHNTAGTTMALSTPLVAMLAVRGRRRSRVFASLAILIIVAASTANISRTGLVLVALLAPASLIVLWTGASPDRNARAWITPIAAVTIVVVLIFGVMILAQPTVATRISTMGERWSSWYPRYLQGRAAVELVEREPLFGHGAGGYRMLVSGTSIGNMYLAPKHDPGTPFTLTLTASNDYLQTLVEWGAIGSVICAAIVVGGMARLGLAIMHPSGRVCRREAALIGLAILAVLAHALVDCPLQVPSLLWATSALLGMAWSAPRWRGEPIDVVAEFLR